MRPSTPTRLIIIVNDLQRVLRYEQPLRRRVILEAIAGVWFVGKMLQANPPRFVAVAEKSHTSPGD